MYERVKARRDDIQTANPDMHPHRAWYLAEQELTPNQHVAYRLELQQRERAWLAECARQPQHRSPQEIIDIHIRNGWDID